jgi:hypothetical protein
MTAQVTLTAFDNALASIKENGALYLKHAIGADAAGLLIVKELKKLPNPSFDEWEALRKAFKEVAPRGALEESVSRQWQRLAKNAEMVKPKSTSAESIIKAQQREADRKKLESVSDDELATRIQKLADLDMKPTKLVAEQKRRQAVKDAPVKEAKAEAIKEIKSALEKADLAIIEKVRKVLGL